MGDSGFDSVLGYFQVTYSYSPHSIAQDSTQLLIEMSPKEFPWGYPEGNSLAGAWNRNICHPICAKCQSRDGSLTFHPPLSLYDLLGKGFYTQHQWTKYWNILLMMQHFLQNHTCPCTTQCYIAHSSMRPTLIKEFDTPELQSLDEYELH